MQTTRTLFPEVTQTATYLCEEGTRNTNLKHFGNDKYGYILITAGQLIMIMKTR